MAVMGVRNSSDGWLALWIEPLGEDRWLRPGETFRVRSDCLGDELAFSVDYWASDDDRAIGVQNVNVWIENGDCYAEVTDGTGQIVECGHQRPAEIGRRWEAAAAAAQLRMANANKHRE